MCCWLIKIGFGWRKDLFLYGNSTLLNESLIWTMWPTFLCSGVGVAKMFGVWGGQGQRPWQCPHMDHCPWSWTQKSWHVGTGSHFTTWRWLIVPVQPLLEILGEVKEEAVVAESERGRQRDTTSGWEKGFLFIMIERDFIQQMCSDFSF